MDKQQFLRNWNMTDQEAAVCVQALRRVMFQQAERQARHLLGDKFVDYFKEAT
jgi:hypothetical protein